MAYLLLPDCFMQFTDQSGRPLSGGSVYFFENESSIPKVTFSGYLGPENTNPVQLSMEGKAKVFLGSGLYSADLYDSNNVLVDHCDGIGTTGTESTENVNLQNTISVSLYADLRNLTQEYGIVQVSGRTTIGDGGQGIFERLPDTVLIDNDGYVLVTGSGVRYQRITDGFMLPEWFGIISGGVVSQANKMVVVDSIASQFGLPLKISQGICVNEDITLSSNLLFLGAGYLFSTTLAQITIASGDISARIGCFVDLDLVFTQIVPKISWILRSSPESIFETALNSYHSIIVDKDLDFLNYYIDTQKFVYFQGGVITLNFTGTLPVGLKIPNIVTDNIQIFKIVTESNGLITDIDFGNNWCHSAWFGGDAPTNCNKGALVIPIASGKAILPTLNPDLMLTEKVLNLTKEIQIKATGSCIIDGTISTTENILVNGGYFTFKIGTTADGIFYGKEIVITDHSFKIVGDSDPGDRCYVGSVAFNADGGVIDRSRIYAPLNAFSGVRDLSNDGSQNIIYFEGRPTISNCYLDDIRSAPILGTDTTGEIVRITYPVIQSALETFQIGNVNARFSSTILLPYDQKIVGATICCNTPTFITLGDEVRFSGSSETGITFKILLLQEFGTTAAKVIGMTDVFSTIGEITKKTWTSLDSGELDYIILDPGTYYYLALIACGDVNDRDFGLIGFSNLFEVIPFPRACWSATIPTGTAVNIGTEIPITATPSPQVTPYFRLVPA
jgi:hypothetical protein